MMYVRGKGRVALGGKPLVKRGSLCNVELFVSQIGEIKMIFYLWLWDSSRSISFNMFSSPSVVLNLFGIYLICSLLTADVLSFLYVFLNPSRLHYILFSSNRWASLYFSTTTTIANEFLFSIIFYCLSSAPAISGCKTSLHFQNSTYILCYIGLSFFFPLSHHDNQSAER